MPKKQQYVKILSRDFCLLSVETWVRGESTNQKGWTKEQQPFLPYIVAEHTDDTVHFYYDLEGVGWIQNLVATMAHTDKDFIPSLEKTVLEKISFIRPIYEKEEAIDLSDLKRFLIELEAGYPWFEAMWWFFQMDDESKVKGLDLENLAKVRSMTDKLCNSSDTVIRKSLRKLYPQLGDLSSVLITEEINSGITPPEKILEERYDHYFFAENRLFTGIAKSIVEEELGVHFEPETIKKVRQLSGSPAYQGIVRGFVRRIMGHKQIAEMRVGEILISPMTIPDFIPAIKKAAAIVTDEGGVLSHAAIVAREFEIPTVVGTSIASKRLKDGDIVEVNATEGKVNLICHAAIVANKLKKPCIIGTHFATDMFEDGDYVEVDADKGTITLINKRNRIEKLKKTMPFNTLFQ
jgi:phosphohistidine swiveling domain-containing protein